MDNIVFIILRRLRQPLLVLIAVFVISMLGLLAIPGQDAEGNPQHMSIFHAFYFVAYMSTTIGFGEVPHAFTDGQRLWVSFCIFASVISWLYAIGTTLSLMQNRPFLHALHVSRFTKRVKRQREPFYLICGYGETGSALLVALSERCRNVVVVDLLAERTALVHLHNLPHYIPALDADVREPKNLIAAGLAHPHCAGVVAITADSEVNLKVAITAKLLHPNVPVITRVESRDIEANMDSFGTDHSINPFDVFARHLSLALDSPCLNILQEWLVSGTDMDVAEPLYPPREGGHWIICSYGRFGRAIYERLKAEGIPVVVVEAHPDVVGEPPEGVILGRGTEAETLLEAGIEDAIGLVAGTNDDANNLSMIMTASQIKKGLFTVARQNRDSNSELFEAAAPDMVMKPSAILAERIRTLLTTPMLHEFLNFAEYQDDTWACELVSRISALIKNKAPAIREFQINASEAVALTEALQDGQTITVSDLMRDPWQRVYTLDCIPLMRTRGNDRALLPPDDLRLQVGDKLLFCGTHSAFTRMDWILGHTHTLDYMLSGEDRPDGWVWRKLFGRPRWGRRDDHV